MRGRLLSTNFNPFLRKKFLRTISVASTSVSVREGTQLKTWKEIPGPSSLPIIGQMHHFLPGGILNDRSVKIQEVMYNKYGPIARMDPALGRPLLIFLFDPEACGYILRSEDVIPVRPGLESLAYYRRHHRNITEEESLNSAGLIDQGEKWRYFRTKVNHAMMQPKTMKLYTSVIDDVAQDMIKRLKSKRDENNKIQGKFDAEMNLWGLESIGVVALGGRLNCLDLDLPEDSPAKRLIFCVHEIFRYMNELDFKPSLWKYFSTKTFKEAMKIYEEHEILAKYFIDKARKEMLVAKKSDDEKGILQKLLEIDERIAVIMACDMLLSGVDTTANTMMGTLYLLATNQDKQDKLRQEVTSGDSRKYLKACLKESMRMMPIAAGNMRETTKEYNLLGYKIPKGAHILFNHQFMSNLDTQYPRPKEYIPERWLEDGPLSHKNAHPFAYSPFGFGVRMCIGVTDSPLCRGCMEVEETAAHVLLECRGVGRRIAQLELETFLARILQNFKVTWYGPPPAIELRSLNYIVGPFNFKFEDVK